MDLPRSFSATYNGLVCSFWESGRGTRSGTRAMVSQTTTQAAFFAGGEVEGAHRPDGHRGSHQENENSLGSCNAAARRIWLNLELAKKPPVCLEYILVHEMVHFLECRHNKRFLALMDQFMPTWRLVRNELNRAPLAYENWRY
ncbi:MAG: M48 family peptidase [Nitrospirae bacterium]|nr:MAG: M48 family peptidase [Nitrospirota bacterium]